MTLKPSASSTSRTLLAACAVACGAVALPAAAQNTGREMGRVISSVPVMQQVAVPRQVCGNEEVYVPGAKSGAGAVIGGIAETQEMLDFCGQHGITSDIEIINMQEINAAYERMLKSDVKYRFVIDMATL